MQTKFKLFENDFPCEFLTNAWFFVGFFRKLRKQTNQQTLNQPRHPYDRLLVRRLPIVCRSRNGWMTSSSALTSLHVVTSISFGKKKYKQPCVMKPKSEFMNQWVMSQRFHRNNKLQSTTFPFLKKAGYHAPNDASSDRGKLQIATI